MTLFSSKPKTATARMCALAYLYENLSVFPVWIRKLTPGQMQNLADRMVRWHLSTEDHVIVPMEEIRKREIIRAVKLCDGNLLKTAKLLKMGEDHRVENEEVG